MCFVSVCVCFVVLGVFETADPTEACFSVLLGVFGSVDSVDCMIIWVLKIKLKVVCTTMLQL